MKILQVITSLRIGGAEKLIVDMVPLYQEHGYKVDVLLFDGTETPFKKQLQEKGMTIYTLGGSGSVYNPLFILRLISFLRRYDIVHTHNTACQYFVVIAKFISSSKISLVTTEHNTTNRRRDIWWFRPIDKFMYRQYKVIISISRVATDLLKAYLRGKYIIETIPNGIDLSVYQQAKPIEKVELVNDISAIIITMVAGFREQKDQDTLIRALALLPTNYRLCLVGDGVRRVSCEVLVKSLGLEDRVIFTGIRSDIPQILKVSDIVVMSSHWEGLSLSSIEGMSVGKPFVASDVNGLHEITEGAGILFPHGDAKALAAVIQQVMEDKVYYQQIAKQCLIRASEYDIRKTVNMYEMIYKKIK